MIFHEDLDLRLQSDGNRFAVHARYDAQEATERFEIGDAVYRELLHIEGADPKVIWNRGADLFDALIRGGVRDLYQRARGRSLNNSSSRFRLRLIFNPNDQRLWRLIELPWEILRDRTADGSDLPALDARRPIVRTIETTEPVLPAEQGSLKRVLLALADPGGPHEVDVDLECAAAKKALARIGIEPQVVVHANRAVLFDAIADSRAEIVHFIGHSDINPETGGVLLLEGKNKDEDRLPGTTFASFFTSRSAPRLVILTSCLSARRGRGQPFAGIAFALVAAGLPAVIAMQSKIAVESAIRFTERLYARLSFKDPIEAAVADARCALKSEKTQSLDWAAPVLFVRGNTRNSSAELQPPVTVTPHSVTEMTVFNHHVKEQTNIAHANRIDFTKGSEGV